MIIFTYCWNLYFWRILVDHLLVFNINIFYHRNKSNQLFLNFISTILYTIFELHKYMFVIAFSSWLHLSTKNYLIVFILKTQNDLSCFTVQWNASFWFLLRNNKNSSSLYLGCLLYKTKHTRGFKGYTNTIFYHIVMTGYISFSFEYFWYSFPLSVLHE